jgi:hypothetical protein
MAEMNPTPLTDDFADPVSIGAGTISLGDTVTYTDLNAGTGEGLVVSIVPDDPTREGAVANGWLLEVLPTGAETSVMVVPTDAVLVVADEGNMDVPDSPMDGDAEMTTRSVAGLAELERAAALADKVRDVLGLLGVDTFGRGAPIRAEGGRFGGSEPGDGESGESGGGGDAPYVGYDLGALSAQVVTSEQLDAVAATLGEIDIENQSGAEPVDGIMGAFQPASASFEGEMLVSGEMISQLTGVPIAAAPNDYDSMAAQDAAGQAMADGIMSGGPIEAGGVFELSNSKDLSGLSGDNQTVIANVEVPAGHPVVNLGSSVAGTNITDESGNTLTKSIDGSGGPLNTGRGSVMLHPNTVFTPKSASYADGEPGDRAYDLAAIETTWVASMPEGFGTAETSTRRRVSAAGKRRTYKSQPRAKVETFIAAELVEDSSLNGLSDDELISELARRWAGDLVNRLNGSETAVSDNTTTEFGGDLEIEIEIGKEGGEEESKGEYPEGCDCCPMCEGVMEVSVNGISAMCPMCGGNGYVPVEDMMMDEPMLDAPVMEPMMDMLYADGDGETAEAQPVKVPGGATYDWEGVLIVEGVASGDGRQIAEGALSWRELPIPLMLQTVNAPGHEGAIIAGSIHEIVREGQNVIGRGYFDSGDAGTEARRLLSEGTMRGVSADIDSVTMEFVGPDGQAVGMEDFLFSGVEAIEVLIEGRIMGATLTPFPAFQEAHVKVITSDVSADDAVLVASGAEVNGDVWRVPSPLGVWFPGEESPEEALAALVASAATTVDVPANPPQSWFLPGDMDKPEPFTVHADGRVYGLVARWGTCHIGFTDRCVNVPKSGSAYKHFRNKNVLTAEGELVATGPVFMDTVHPDLRLKASDTQAFYADTGCAVADVALYENEHGIVAAGALRPGLTPEQVRRFRGSDVSPDWRQIKGRLEVVGLLSVNVSGFIVEGLVASGATVSNPRGVWDSTEGELTTLVAAGMIRHAETEMSELREELAAMRSEMADFREAVRPIRAQRASERFALLAQAFGDKHPETVEHGCGGACGGSDGVCACGS